MAIRVRGLDAAHAHRAIDAAFAAIEAVQRLMSFHDPDSDVGRLNREAFVGPVKIDPRTRAVLAAAQEFAAESGGAFDITVAPRLERRGLLPAGAEATDPAADWRDVELLDDGRVRFRRRLRIDLGGIAKGFAVDEAVARLREEGVAGALVDAGGDLRAFGPRGYRVALRHPDPRLGGASGWRVDLRNAALAGSAGGFAETRTGERASALVDPRARANGDQGDTAADEPPFCPAHGVAVKAPTAMAADALTKIALLAPPDVAEAVLARHGAAAVRLVPEP